MEVLTLPRSGSVYLYANSLIYSVERVEPYRTLLDPMWEQAREGDFTIVSSEAVVLEALVKPLREGNRVAERLFRSLFASSDVKLIPATRLHWEEAARLRAETGLQASDALHAATARQAGCALFITNDADFRRIQDLPIAILDDLVSDESQE